jgi:hypothetical protein
LLTGKLVSISKHHSDARRARRFDQQTGVSVQQGPQMTGHGEKFGRKKEAAIAALLSQRSVDDAARDAGISTNRRPQ